MEHNDVYNNFWMNEEDFNFLKEWYNEKIEFIKELMKESGSLVYTDYSVIGLTGGLPITYVAKPEDLYTEEELLKQKFNGLIKEMEKKDTVKLHKYEKYINVHKDPYEGFTLLNRTPKAGEIFMIDDITDKLWELGRTFDDGNVQIFQLVKEDKETGFIPPFEIWTINPKEHRFWATLTPETKNL